MKEKIVLNGKFVVFDTVNWNRPQRYYIDDYRKNYQRRITIWKILAHVKV